MRKKPKILLLKAAPEKSALGHASPSWDRLSKALVTFTELETREAPLLSAEDLASQSAEFDLTFLDTSLANWTELKKNPSPICLVQVESFSWVESQVRAERLPVLTHIPLLLLEEFSPSDLLRILHLYLMPKRLAGVLPIMEKGSVIIADKLMETGGVGQLLDRVSHFIEKLEGFTLQSRVPDLRQILSALLLEGIYQAREKGVNFPFVDFQASANKQRLAVNLRFPLGNKSMESLLRETLSGESLFWNQIWQCSDFLMLTNHTSQSELEVMVLICQPHRSQGGRFRSFLYKSSSENKTSENLLAPPNAYRFQLASELSAVTESDMAGVTSAASGKDSLNDISDQIGSKIRHQMEQNRMLSEHLSRKDQQIQDLTRKSQQLNQELHTRRAELLKAEQSRRTQLETAERRIQELEHKIKELQPSPAEIKQEKEGPTISSLQDANLRMETQIRSAETDRKQLKENIDNERKRAALLEQKYAQVHKDIVAKDREILELKANFAKLRKDSEKAVRNASGDDKKDSSPGRLKELEDREAVTKQEMKRVSFKLESMEKTHRAQQAELTDKVKLYEQKLKQAKAREVDLLRKIDELASTLKKAVNKAA